VIALVFLASGCAGALISGVFCYTRGWEAGLAEGAKRSAGGQQDVYASRVTTRPIKGPEQVFESDLDYDNAVKLAHRHHGPSVPCTEECHTVMREIQRRERGH
jgi:hypothetical protein